MGKKASRSDFLEEIAWRGLLYQQTAEAELQSHILPDGPGRVGYCGFDPTADSLTIGNFIAIRMLMHWQAAGHTPIVLLGGGTGMIGDPSGKDSERPLLTAEQVAANLEGQRRIFETLLDFDPARPNAARIVDNGSWLGSLGFLEVLRDVGKHFSVNAMIQKDSVRDRLENRAQGITYTEFSYSLLQAYDFFILRRDHGCSVQLAGSDQYGNIVAGIDLIRRKLGPEAEAYGITAPLLTHADGRKIGKSEGGAVWLTRDRTSPYAFYQYWINVPDDDAVPFLRWFTSLAREEAEDLAVRHGHAPQERIAQRALAGHMTDLLHGVEARRGAEAASEALFGGGDLGAIDADTLEQVAEDLPHSSFERARLSGEGASLVEVLTDVGLAPSKRQAREFLQNGAVWVNGERVPAERRLLAADLLHRETILLRRGRKQWHATRWR